MYNPDIKACSLSRLTKMAMGRGSLIEAIS